MGPKIENVEKPVVLPEGSRELRGGPAPSREGPVEGGRGRVTDLRSRTDSHTPVTPEGSADDGKRFVEVPSGTSCAERFMWQERDAIEKNRGRSRRGMGSGSRLHSRVGGFMFMELFVFP